MTRVDTRNFQLLLAAATLGPWLGVLALASAGVDPTVGVLAPLAVVFGIAHVGPSMAFYLDRECREIMDADRVRYYLAPIGVLAAIVAVAVVSPPEVVDLLLVGIFGWRIHHTTKQTLGVISFLCRSRRVAGLTGDERTALQLTSVTGFCGIASLTPRVAEVMPGWVPFVGVAALAGSVWFLRRSFTGDPVRIAALLVAVVFYLPTYWSPTILAAAAAIGMAHGAQYVAMTSKLRDGRTAPQRRWTTLALLAGVVAYGLPLQEMSHHMHVPLILGLYYGLVVAHFQVDAGMWKLSQPAQRAYMQRRFAFL